MDKLISHLETFVYLQTNLWALLQSKFKKELDPLLINLPSKGNIEFNKVCWNYTKHGLGVCFKEKNGRRKINFHRIQDGAEKFDAYALSTYFGSLGREGTKILEDVGITTEKTERNLKTLLIKLHKNGAIQSNGSSYYLS